MAAFTMYLWEVMEHTADIGLSEYPIFDEEYREGLNKKITDHYYNREIGQETVEMFTFAMRRKMNEVMPYFNQLYESTRLEYDPLSTLNISRVHDGDVKESSTGNRTEAGSVAVTGTSETTGARDTTGESESNGTSRTSDERTRNTSGSTTQDVTGSESQDVTGANEKTTDSTHDESSRNVASDFPQVMLSPNADYASSGVDSTGKAADAATSTETSTQNSESVTSQNTEGTSTETAEDSGVSDTKTSDKVGTTTNETSNSATDETSNTLSTGNADTQQESTRVEKDSDTTTGYNMHTVDMIMRYRDSLINVDMLIIDVLAELFMLIWDTSDTYTTRGFYYGY